MAYQAALAVMAGLLAGCTIPKEVNPVEIYREVTGLSDEGRLPPPGLDQPFPHLSVVPPRPERPPLAAREAVSNALVADRSNARTPLEPGQAAAGEGRDPAFTAAPGNPPVPAGPPQRAALSGVPPIPWDERRPYAPAAAAPRPLPGPPAATGPAPAEPAAPAAAPPDMPAAPPALPPPDLLGPLPSAAPPPPPSPDLLAPAPRR
jgi:hypothetical protein